MVLQIIEARVQSVWFSQTEIVTPTRGPDKDKTVARERRFKTTIGTYLEFDDGHVINGPDGRRRKGRGTVVRRSYKHGTWSVQRPQRCELNNVGYVFTPQNEPCWLRDERESGFSFAAFKRDFSVGFVELCVAGQALAHANASAHRRNRRDRSVHDDGLGSQRPINQGAKEWEEAISLAAC